ncbi:hypothetical protein ERJ75_000085400 [Trypanosoma vivax]|nr:hypothetical protein ERJ75_000085400 [Trypanosoma vivax]
MALFFRCVFLALLGAAALGDKSAESARTTRTNSRLDVLTGHRGGGKYPRIQPRSVVTSVPGSESNTSSSVPGIQTTVINGSTSPVVSTAASPPAETREDCNCSEEEEEKKKKCAPKCEKRVSKSKSKIMEKNEVSHSVPKKPEGQEQQEQEVTIQGEGQQGLENGSENTGNQAPAAGSPETPNSKPAAEQVGGSSSENRPGAEKEHAAPQKSDKQLGSTNNDEPAKDNVDKTRSNGDTSEKEKAENNNEAKGERDGQEKSIGSNEGRSEENGSAETSSANLSGKTLTVLLLAIFARFGV